MSGTPSGRAQYTVACGCGASMSLDARSFGRPRPCRSCGASVTVAWGRDPNSRKTVPVAMSQKKPAPKPAAAAASAAPGVTQDLLKAFCGCGNSKRVPATQRNNPPRCICGKLMRIEDAPAPPKPIGKIEKFERTKQSAPLLPLHLRAPLRARIKKGAQFFDCVCGERVLIRAGSEGRPIQCAACDRFHTLEIEGAPPPGPAPEPGAKPRGAGPAVVPTRPLTLGEFLCQCGEIQPPRTSRTGRDFACKKCGRTGHVEMDRDPQTQAVKMRPVFKTGPTAAAGPSKGTGAPPPAPASGAPAWTCPCGRSIEAHVAMSKSDASCPGCGRKIRLEKWRHPHSSMTMIRPVFGDPEPPPGRPAPAAKPLDSARGKPFDVAQGKPPAKLAEELVSFEELEPMEMDSEAAVFEVAAGSDGGDAPPTVDGDAQIAPCECGAEILLSTADVGHTIQCPACADTMVVEQEGMKITLRVVGALDDPDWKLEEFQ